MLGLFVAHNDQPRINNIVKNIQLSIDTEIRFIHAPGMGSLGYSQLRGFLYILSAGIYCNLCRSNRILVTECGPTMYQPLFSPYDSITYTTHPYILKAAKEVLNILLNKKIKIIIPFENLTKAEVISNSFIKDFSQTHSCISQRFGDHDGSCFGCVIKRLSCIISNVKDVEYRKNIFNNRIYNDNLANLIIFSNDILTNFDKMYEFQIDKILEFDKKDLFQRYSLDNLAGFMLGTNKKHKLYKRCSIDDTILLKRISQVRTNRNKPNFNRIVE